MCRIEIPLCSICILIMYILKPLGAAIAEALWITSFDQAARCAAGGVNGAIKRLMTDTEMLTAAVRFGAEALHAEVTFYQPAEDVAATLTAPPHQILGADEDPTVGGVTTTGSAAAAIEFTRHVRCGIHGCS